MKLEDLVHTALDELCMQMIGAQVLFGFQLQVVFQEGFAKASSATRLADMAALSFIILALGLLIAAASEHRLVEGGKSTLRIFRAAQRFAAFSLPMLAASMGCAVFVACQRWLGETFSLVFALGTFACALLFWCGIGSALRASLSHEEKSMKPPEQARTGLHEKIDQMLTEARVVVPGAQVLMGFQLIATMSKAFEELPEPIRYVHFCALALLALAIILLISPAAVHRLGFDGLDVERVHKIGTVFVTAALLPLALGLSADLFVAGWEIFGSFDIAMLAAGAAIIVLISLWYLLPLAIRARQQRG